MMQPIFSENGQISKKQFVRMLAIPTFSSLIFVLPHLGAKLFGQSVLIGFLILLILSFLYMCILNGIQMLGPINLQVKMREKITTKLMKRILLCIQIARQVIHISFYIILSVEILKEAQVPLMQESDILSGQNGLIVCLLLLVVIYGANRNIEKIGRLYESLYYLIFIPFILMLCFGIKECAYEVFVPKLDLPLWKTIVYAYGLIVFFVPMEQYLYLLPSLKTDQNEKISPFFLLKSIGLSMLLSLFMIGIYGVCSAKMSPMISVDIMRYIRLPLGILERFDVLMVCFFMLGCFLLICSSLFYSGHLAGKLKLGKRIWWLFGIIFISLIFAFRLPNYTDTLTLYIFYGAIFDVPLSIILLLMESVIYE